MSDPSSPPPNPAGGESAGTSPAPDLDLEQLVRLFTIPIEPAKALIKVLMDTFFHIEVTGTESIPLTGGGIIISNHTDYIDVPVQGVNCPRKCIYVGKQELFEPEKDLKKFLFQEGSPLNLPPFFVAKALLERALEVYGAATRIQLMEFGGQPIKRSFKGDKSGENGENPGKAASARDAVQYYKDLEDHMVEMLKAGEFISIYPEGTRTETGVIGPFKAMAAKLAIRAGVPIVPSGISGAWKFLTLESFLSGRMFKTHIQYNIGQPIMPEEFPEGDEKRAAKELTARLERDVYALIEHPERRNNPRSRARVL
ncbi:MAG: 1-acyl-sn-glycerol-3-phosphate acyltransferase [bacterium]|nr:1-acyl-sn-glycerol-3-phosphate acyltransferase [bacterium]